MRRSEKEITDRKEIDAIINQAQVCRIGLTDGQKVYIVPMCFGYDGQRLYFHSASAGKKLELLERSDTASFEIDTDVSIVTNTNACNFSMRYKSVIGSGKVELHDKNKQKQKALNQIMAHYNGPQGPYGEQMLARVKTFAINITELTAKQA